MPVLNETLAVLGCGSAAASVALCAALKFKTRSGSLIIQDTTGRGATILSATNKMGLDRRTMVWVDLADRRRPVSLFQVRRSAHFRGIWAGVLKSIRRVAKSGIGDGVLDWAAEAAYALSSDGSVGLGALFRCLSSPETRHWFLQTGNEPSELGKLLDLLAWALSFPAVHAISEGENRGNLLDALARPTVVWLESAIEHFEPKEHLLVQVLAEAAVEDTLRTLASDPLRWTETMKGLTVLHLYPASPIALPLEEWVQTHLGAVRHVGVHRLDPDCPLPPQTLHWVQRSEFLWVAGPAGPLRQGCHDAWLSNTEAGRISGMVGGGLWIRSNRSGKALVTQLRDWKANPGMKSISLIYLQGFGISISVDAQVRLAEHDIPVVFAPPFGNPVAVVNPIETARASIRRLQAIRRDEPDVVKAGMSMIAAKISNQAAVLKYFAKYRKRIAPDTAGSMMKSAENMLALSDSVAHLDSGEANVRAAAMGFEGHAAAIYWRQLAALIPAGLGFGGRITLSAEDPVNQCLNYIYGILYGEVWRAVVKAGLDPYFGLMHGSVRDQGSLVFDLIEEFRAPFGDRVVVGMLGRGFQPEIGRSGFLRTRSKQQLVRSFTKRWARPMNYRSRDVAPAKLLAMQANSLADVFRREGNYHPYRMRW